MHGLGPNLVEHQLVLHLDAKPVKEKLRRLHPKLALKAKEEVDKIYITKFIWAVLSSWWIANVVPACVKKRWIGWSQQNLSWNGFALPREILNAHQIFPREPYFLRIELLYSILSSRVTNQTSSAHHRCNWSPRYPIRRRQPSHRSNFERGQQPKI